MKASTKNILFYVNSQFGIGHFERCYNILEYLEGYSELNPFLLYGGIEYGRFDLLKKVKKCKLSSLTFQSVDNSVSSTPISPEKGLNVNQILDSRKEQILAFVKGNNFSLLLIEYFPFSKQSLAAEVEFLIDLISSKKLKIVISIRDFMTIDNGFHREYAESFLKKYCTKILCHCDPTLSTLDYTYGNINSFHEKIIYTGYIFNKFIKKVKSNSNPKKKIILSSGAGRDGAEVYNLFFQAFSSLPISITKAYEIHCFIGQQMQHYEINEIREISERNVNCDVFLRDFSEYRKSLNCCLISVSMCGYNTAIELLESNIPYVIFIPRNRTEQILRAEAFSKISNTYWTRSVEKLKELLISALENSLPRKKAGHIKSDGIKNTVKIFEDLIHE